MAAHVPTMLAMIIVSSLMMAASMAVVGWGRRRDGLGRWAAALLVNAIGHGLIMLRGLVPDLLSVVLGNLLLSCVFVGMIAAIRQFQGQPARWLLLMAPPALVTGFVIAFIAALFALGVVIWLIGKLVTMVGLRPFDRALGADGHKYRGLDIAMGGGQFSGSGLAVAGTEKKCSWCVHVS